MGIRAFRPFPIMLVVSLIITPLVAQVTSVQYSGATVAQIQGETPSTFSFSGNDLGGRAEADTGDFVFDDIHVLRASSGLAISAYESLTTEEIAKVRFSHSIDLYNELAEAENSQTERDVNAASTGRVQFSLTERKLVKFFLRDPPENGYQLRLGTSSSTVFTYHSGDGDFETKYVEIGPGNFEVDSMLSFGVSERAYKSDFVYTADLGITFKPVFDENRPRITILRVSYPSPEIVRVTSKIECNGFPLDVYLRWGQGSFVPERVEYGTVDQVVPVEINIDISRAEMEDRILTRLDGSQNREFNLNLKGEFGNLYVFDSENFYLTPPPSLGPEVIIRNGLADISVVSEPGFNYKLQFRSALDSGNWESFGDEKPYTGRHLRFVCPIYTSSGFFRIIASPAPSFNVFE